MFCKEDYDNEVYVKQEADKLIVMMQTEGDLVPMIKKYIIDYYNPVEDVSDESDDDTAPCKINIIQAQMTKIFRKVRIPFLLLVMVMIGVNNNLFSCNDRKELAAYLHDSKFWRLPENSSVVMMLFLFNKRAEITHKHNLFGLCMILS